MIVHRSHHKVLALLALQWAHFKIIRDDRKQHVALMKRNRIAAPTVSQKLKNKKAPPIASI